jgi:hypothetical protein
MLPFGHGGSLLQSASAQALAASRRGIPQSAFSHIEKVSFSVSQKKNNYFHGGRKNSNRRASTWEMAECEGIDGTRKVTC